MSVLYQPKYRSSTTVGVGTAFNSLATSSTRVAGAQTDEYNNSTNRDDDILLSGSVKLGTSPTASKQVDIWVVACKDAASAYPDTITGAGAATKTLTSENVRNGAAKLLTSLLTDATTGRLLEFSNESVARLFGGNCPQRFVIFVAHDSAVNLDASAGFVCNALGVMYEGT